jgi:hypothetical protein
MSRITIIVFPSIPKNILAFCSTAERKLAAKLGEQNPDFWSFRA